MSAPKPLTPAVWQATLSELVSLCERGRDVDAAFEQMKRHTDQRVADAAQRASAVFGRSKRLSAALQTWRPLTKAEVAALDQTTDKRGRAGVLRHLLSATEHERLVRDAWFGAVFWQVAVLWAAALLTPLTNLAWLKYLPSSTPWLWLWASLATAVAVGVPRAVAANATWVAQLQGGEATVQGRRMSRLLWALQSTLSLRITAEQAFERAAQLVSDEELMRAVRRLPRGRHWSSLLPGVGPAAQQSLTSAKDRQALIERVARVHLQQRKRWIEGHQRLCRLVRLVLAGVALVVSVWSSFGAIERLSRVELPDGRILNPERIESLIETEVPKARPRP